MEETTVNRPSKKHMALTFCIGLVFIILVIWLLVSIVLGVIGLFRAGDVYSEGLDTQSITAAAVLQDQLTDVKVGSDKYFEVLLTDLVMQDVPSFASPDELDSEYVISYGLWQAITLNNSQGILTSGEDGQIYRVPKSLVEKLATYTLPYTDKIEHQTVDLCGTFTYNKLNGTYAIPISYPADYLVPKVVSASVEGDTAAVTVDCYQYNEEEEDPTANESNFRKREIFTLKAVKNTDPSEAAIEETHYQVVKMTQVEKSSEDKSSDK